MLHVPQALDAVVYLTDAMAAAAAQCHLSTADRAADVSLNECRAHENAVRVKLVEPFSLSINEAERVVVVQRAVSLEIQRLDLNALQHAPCVVKLARLHRTKCGDELLLHFESRLKAPRLFRERLITRCDRGDTDIFKLCGDRRVGLVETFRQPFAVPTKVCINRAEGVRLMHGLKAAAASGSRLSTGALQQR